VVALATPAAGAPEANGLSQPFPAATAHTVTLITGDQVTLYPAVNGTTNYSIRPAAGSSGFESFQGPNGDRYVIPASVVPYLGRLDRALFDVSALAAAGDPTTLPVQLTFAPGVAPTAPAGVTLTATGTTTATGYVTAASAPAFGAALRKQIGADVAAGRKPGTGALFGGVSGISLTGGPQGGVQPHYPLHILQVNATDITGQPAQDADVLLINTDSVSKEIADIPVVGGLGRVAVPAGDYSAFAFFADFDASGNATALRQVTVGDFTVADSTTPSSVTVDERTATAKVGAVSPKPAVEGYLATTVVRLDATGQGTTFGIANLSPATTGVYVNPTPKPAVGSLHYAIQWTGAAPTATDHYRVDLAFASEDIPADETFVGKPDQLATLHDVVYADPAGTTPTAVLSGALDPVLAQFGYGAYGFAVPTPGVYTDYLGTADTGEWVQSAFLPDQVIMQGEPHTYAAHRGYSVQWSRTPLGAGLGQWTSPQFCDACSAGSTLSLAIPMFRDSEPDHTGFPITSAIKVHFALYQGSTVLFDGDNFYGASVTVPGTPAAYRGVLDVDQSAVPGVSQATRTHTEETVQYSPTATNTPLPSTDGCAGQTTTTPCEILGALTLGYDFYGQDLTNTTKSPVQVLGLRVGHVTYNGVGSCSPIRKVTVSVSFDNGTTWQQVPVAGVGGNYTAVWPNPSSAAGTAPSVRVTATDAAGDAVSQTITNAYTIAKSTH
jgi:hypothetical protein